MYEEVLGTSVANKNKRLWIKGHSFRWYRLHRIIIYNGFVKPIKGPLFGVSASSYLLIIIIIIVVVVITIGRFTIGFAIIMFVIIRSFCNFGPSVSVSSNAFKAVV